MAVKSSKAKSSAVFQASSLPMRLCGVPREDHLSGTANFPASGL